MTELPDATVRLLTAMPDLETEVRLFPEGTKTAEDAATAIGCGVAAIVKSLVFVVIADDGTESPVVALVPGDMKLDTRKLAIAAGGASSRRASLDEVRDATGFVAGGAPPFGYPKPLNVYADPALTREDPLWAAGGTPTTVFPISVADLDRLASPTWTQIAQV